MPTSEPPKVTSVEVIATRPTDADSAAIAHLAALDRRSLPHIAQLVMLHFESMPEATSQGWALYVSDFRIPKYWAYDRGIYFKVFDPQFFHDHQGQPLRFSSNDTDFIDTGLRLPTPRYDGASSLPHQDDVLKR
jgi:hypothetical protein